PPCVCYRSARPSSSHCGKRFKKDSTAASQSRSTSTNSSPRCAPPIRMLELRLRPNARRDLASIWSYTSAHWSAIQADRYLTAINREIGRLREKPEIGREVRNLQRPFLKRSCGGHVIFYLVENGTLDIVRVLHER